MLTGVSSSLCASPTMIHLPQLSRHRSAFASDSISAPAAGDIPIVSFLSDFALVKCYHSIGLPCIFCSPERFRHGGASCLRATRSRTVVRVWSCRGASWCRPHRHQELYIDRACCYLCAFVCHLHFSSWARVQVLFSLHTALQYEIALTSCSV